MAQSMGRHHVDAVVCQSWCIVITDLQLLTQYRPNDGELVFRDVQFQILRLYEQGSWPGGRQDGSRNLGLPSMDR